MHMSSALNCGWHCVLHLNLSSDVSLHTAETHTPNTPKAATPTVAPFKINQHAKFTLRPFMTHVVQNDMT